VTEIAARLVRPIRRLGRLSFLALLLASLVAAVAVLALVRGYMLRDSVLPGVRVAGVDVGGLSRADARGRIESRFGERLSRPIDVSLGGGVFTVTPSNLFTVEAAATEELAFDSARDSFLERVAALTVPFAAGQDVDPVLRVNPSAARALRKELKARTHRPVSARISMDGLEPVVRPGKTGTRVDEAAVLALVRDAALKELPSVRVPLRTLTPMITTSDAQAAAAQVRRAVSAPVALRFRHRDLGRLEPETTASLIRFRAEGGEYRVVLKATGLQAELAPLVERYTKDPVDASFRIDGKRARVVKGKNGTTLDVGAAQDAVLAAAALPNDREARIGLASLKPNLTTAKARGLGIRRQVSTFTTDMGVSSSNRIWNIHLMADYIDGTIIKPGKTFSFNQTVGERTTERGFREGQMILGSLLLPAIGGGVCQTATTLFNNALQLGLPINERRNHSWYISHYPIGRDATVNWGGPDFSFKNDLDHALLIKSSYTDSTLTFTFFGTNPHRKVDLQTGPQTNFTSPKPSYAYDPTAPEGSIRTVTGSHESGFDITVYRKVWERGKVIRKDSFVSHYVAVGDTVIYGPGTHPPRIDFVIPSI
jgi:vancomycin resistance protein YoaR